MSRQDTNSAITNDRAHTARRTIVKGAAWSIPVVAAAVAAPMAAASLNNATLAFSNSSTSLLQLRLLDGGGTLTAKFRTTVPTQLTLTNGPGDLNGLASVTITVGRPSGINLTLGPARGFGVAAYNGIDSTSAQRDVDYNSSILGDIGFPFTTFTTTQNVSVASNDSLTIPIEMGLAGKTGALSISALASFPVTITMVIGDKTFTTSSFVSVPANAGLL